MYGSSLDGMFAGMIVLAMAAGAAIFAFLFWFIPWAWELIKPWLHQVTA